MTYPEQASVDSAVLLCAPFGQEYMRSHKSFSLLASMLNRRGVAVMRFDYYGTGDSYGESQDISIREWRENTLAAIEELQAITRVAKVKIIGLRLGATIAYLASLRSQVIEHLILWDPVLQGDCYLKDSEANGIELEGQDWWVDGFVMPAQFRQKLVLINLMKNPILPNTRVDLVTYRHGDSFDRFYQQQLSRGGDIHRQLVPSQGDWNYNDNLGGTLVPQVMLQSLSACLLQQSGE